MESSVLPVALKLLVEVSALLLELELEAPGLVLAPVASD